MALFAVTDNQGETSHGNTWVCKLLLFQKQYFQPNTGIGNATGAKCATISSSKR